MIRPLAETITTNHELRTEDMTEKQTSPQKKPLKPSGPKPPLPKYSRGPFSWLLIGLVVMFVLMTLTKMNRVQPLKFSEFETYVEKGYVQNADLNESARKIKGELTDAAVEALNQGDKVVAKVYECATPRKCFRKTIHNGSKNMAFRNMIVPAKAGWRRRSASGGFGVSVAARRSQPLDVAVTGRPHCGIGVRRSDFISDGASNA